MADARTNVGRAGNRRSQALNNRSTSLLVAVLCAVVAGVLIYLFVSHYNKNNSTAAATQVTIYKATTYIPRGTPQSTITQNGWLQAAQVPSNQVPTGSVTDPTQIVGQVSSAAIGKGQAATTTDFTASNVTIASYLTGHDRAIAFAIDPPHGLTSYITQGSSVDIMGQNGGTAEVLAQNVTVLANADGDVVLRVTDKQALNLAADTGVSTMWLTLRPVTGVKETVHVGSSTVKN
jgi:Flp pilus assembly protein CpaB